MLELVALGDAALRCTLPEGLDRREDCVLKVSNELERARPEDVDVGGINEQVKIGIELEHRILDDP